MADLLTAQEVAQALRPWERLEHGGQNRHRTRLLWQEIPHRLGLCKLHPHGHHGQANKVQGQQRAHGQRLDATTSMRRVSVRAGVSLVVTRQMM
jgi:hypothetical protein